jgi:sortase A
MPDVRAVLRRSTPEEESAPGPPAPAPPLSPKLQVARAALLACFLLSVSMVIQLIFLSSLQQRSAQQQHFDHFRSDLAKGTAPVAPVNDDDEVLAPGTPMAYLEIPAIGLRQVVLEGTSSGVTFEGPGHRQDSPFPGQVGTTVVLGRRAAFGGPFAQIGELSEGDVIRLTSGQGAFDYEVIGVRHEGDPAPGSLGQGEGRLLLVTADGRPLLPDGVLRVDASLTSEPVGGAAPLYRSSTLPPAEQLMGSDTSTLWALLLWLQALVVVVLGAVWAWHRWGRTKAWIVFIPLGLVVGLMVAEQAARLLPNML